MHSIKITAFSCALLFSCASYSSAPAQSQIDPDELEIPEIHLVPKKDAHDELELATKDLRSLVKYSRNKDLVKKVHQTYCASEKHLASYYNAEQHIKNCGQQDISQGLRDEVQTFKTLREQQNQQWLNLIKQVRGNPDQLWSVFCLETKQRNMYFAQALLLRAEKEELIKEKETIRLQYTAQIQQQATEIHQQAAQINQLRALLEQQEPGGQQMEGMPHQLPSAPGGIK